MATTIRMLQSAWHQYSRCGRENMSGRGHTSKLTYVLLVLLKKRLSTLRFKKSTVSRLRRTFRAFEVCRFIARGARIETLPYTIT